MAHSELLAGGNCWLPPIHREWPRRIPRGVSRRYQQQRPPEAGARPFVSQPRRPTRKTSCPFGAEAHAPHASMRG